MSTAFHFRAVASDGKLRTGTLTADSERVAAQELKRQGLIPVYVGPDQKRAFQIVLPSFNAGRRSDILFFTQGAFDAVERGRPRRPRSFDPPPNSPSARLSAL